MCGKIIFIFKVKMFLLFFTLWFPLKCPSIIFLRAYYIHIKGKEVGGWVVVGTQKKKREGESESCGIEIEFTQSMN